MFIARHSRRLLPYAVWLVFALLLAFGKSVHELWRDEAFTWLLVRYSSAGELFSALPDVAHPILWYALQWPLAHLGLPVSAMVWLHYALCIAFAALLLGKARLPLMVVAAYLFSFQHFYAFGVLSRGYMLMLLLLWLTGLTFSRRFERPLPYACALALLAHTELWVSPLVLVLGGEFALGVLRRGRPFHPFLLPLLVLAASALFFAVSMWPPEEASRYSRHFMWSPSSALNHLGEGLLPIVIEQARYAGTFFFYRGTPPEELRLFQQMLAGSIFMLCAYGCRDRPVLVIAFTATFAWYAYILATRYEGHYWHSALVPAFLLFFHFLSGALGGTGRDRVWFVRLFTFAMLYSVVATGVMLAKDRRENYSGGEAMARFMIQNGYDRQLVILDHCTLSRSLSVHLPQTRFFMAPQRAFTPLASEAAAAFDHCFRPNLSWSLSDIVKYKGSLLVLHFELPEGFGLELLHATTGYFREDYYLYRLKR